jgi:hypothetical protein
VAGAGEKVQGLTIVDLLLLLRKIRTILILGFKWSKASLIVEAVRIAEADAFRNVLERSTNHRVSIEGLKAAMQLAAR